MVISALPVVGDRLGKVVGSTPGVTVSGTGSSVVPKA